ncbi:MAG TPA: 4Fe-4S binding protein [Chloroflexota bacterium]
MISITVDKAFCKGCNLCIESCPRDVLAVSSQRGANGFLVPEAVRPEACTDCKMCELVCPDLAIYVNGKNA